MCKNEKFDIFWKELLKESKRKLLFILGKGLDHRMCMGLKKILTVDTNTKIDCVLINYNEGDNSPSHKHDDLITKNYKQLLSLLEQNGINIIEKDIEMIEDESGRKRSGTRNIRELFMKDLFYMDYSDIIIDISAMPYSIYFPAIQILLIKLEGYNMSNTIKKNLFVVISESPKYDANINSKEIVQAQFMFGLEGNLDTHSQSHLPKIWLPILGEKKLVQFKEIQKLVDPIDICYILPFPSKNPRRGDSIFLEFKEIMLNDKQKRNLNNQILYAAEQDPFDLYRILLNTIEKYENTLKLLCGCQCVISALSSKILSLGVLLTVYSCHKNNKNNVGIAYTEAKGYNITDEVLNNPNNIESEHFAIWLEGECYYK